MLPFVRQEVSLIAALPAMASLYGRTLIDTLHSRVGEEEQLRARDDLAEGDYFNGGWTRVLTHHGQRDGDPRGVYGAGPSFDYDFAAVQVGADFYRKQDEPDGHRTHAGAFVAYGKGDGEVEHSFINWTLHAGRNKFDARTLGFYWTTFAASGSYLDAVAQLTDYEMTAQSLRFPANRTDALGVALSLEGGLPRALGEHWRIEPQGQVIYQSLDVDSFRDPFATVRFSQTDSLAARAGARLARRWTSQSPGGATRLTDGWLVANVWHEFKGDPQTEFSTARGYVPFRADLGGSWYQLGIGLTLQVTSATYLYGDVEYARDTDGDDEAVNAKLGVRIQW